MPVATRQRVVVADDSGLMRRVVTNALEREGFEVVGAAADGDEALALCQHLRPDAMTLDLAMPGLDGMGVLRALRGPAAADVPVVVVSAFSPAHGARAVDALAEGAFDLVAKPVAGQPLQTFVTELGAKVRAATRALRPRTSRAGSARAAVRSTRPGVRAASPRAVVIASSTGGPRALAELMPKLPGRLGAGTLIVQHMPAGFTASLAHRLDRASELTIREAAGADTLDPTVALIAPGGSHLRVSDGRLTRLSDEPAIGALRPRADLTITDVAEAYGDRTLLVVLTGMGRDGLDGARAVKRRGGRVLVEAESSCTVYGMPRAVAEAGLADAILDLRDLPHAVAEEAGA
jgi:two-component system chemotaxis response regulator CheB